MNRIILTGILLAFGIISLFAQYTENRTVSAYDKISICCGIDLYLSEGTDSDLRIEVNNEKLLSGIKTEVRGGELIISYDDKNLKRRINSQMKIYTNLNNLSAIKATSGADVISQTPLNADDIQLSATSGADIKLDLTARKVTCSSTSGSDIVLKGKAVSATLKATSGSDIDLSNMKVERVDAEATSGSDIRVYVIKELNGKATSGADIIYIGNPEKVNKKQSSGGTVKQK